MHARCSTTKSYNSYVHHMPPPPTLEITDVPRPSRPGWLSIGPWVLPSRMFFDTFGHRGVRASGSAPPRVHALAWPRVTGRLSSEVRPGVRVSGSRVRHVATRDTSHGPSRRHVGRWVMLMRVRGRAVEGRVRRTCAHVRCVACIAHGFNYSQECGCELGDIHRASTRTRYSKTHSIPPIERVAHVSSSRLRASGKAVGRTSCFA